MRITPFLVILTLGASARAAPPECVVRSASADAVVSVKHPTKKQDIIIGVRKTKVTAHIGRAKQGRIPVEVDGALRFEGDAIGLPLVFEPVAETTDGVTRFESGAPLRIVAARPPEGSAAWSFELAFADDPAASIVVGASFRCDHLALAGGPDERQRTTWELTQTGLPEGDDGTRWMPRTDAIRLRAMDPGSRRELTVRLDRRKAFELARFAEEGGEVLVGREVAPGAYVVGWTDARNLVASKRQVLHVLSALGPPDNIGAFDGLQASLEGSLVHEPPDAVMIDLAEGAPVRVSPGGPAFATIGKAGRYRTRRLADGSLVLAIPGVTLDLNVGYVDAAKP